MGLPAAILAPLIAQGAMAGGQLIGGLISGARNKRPDLAPLRQNIEDAERVAAQAQERARFGYTPEQRAARMAILRNQYGASRAATRNLGGSRQQQLAGLYAAERMRGTGELGVLAESDALRLQKQQYADRMAQLPFMERARLLSAQNDIYQQRAEASSGMIGAGLQNAASAAMLPFSYQMGQDRNAALAGIADAYRANPFGEGSDASADGGSSEQGWLSSLADRAAFMYGGGRYPVSPDMIPRGASTAGFVENGQFLGIAAGPNKNAIIARPR